MNWNKDNVTPPKFNKYIDTKNDGPWKMYLLSNIAMLAIYSLVSGG